MTVFTIAVRGLAAGLAAGALALTASAALARQSFDEALELLEQDAPAGMAAFEALAAEGDVEAMNIVAALLHEPPEGSPISADPDRAVALWEASVAGGSMAARVNYGTRLLLNDAGADDARAVAMLREVDNEQMIPLAAYGLGRAYLFGNGVEQDLERGSRLLILAVEAHPDNMDAQFLVGRAYQNGWGIPADAAAGYRHLKIAADAGDSRALWNIGMMLLNGDGVATNPRLAREHVRASAEAGYDQGMISLAVMLALGQGGEIDAVEARDWYRRAATDGSAHALRGLGAMLFVGEGGPADQETGAAYLHLAAEAGDDQAPLLLERFAGEIAVLDRSRIEAARTLWIREHGVPGTQ